MLTEDVVTLDASAVKKVKEIFQSMPEAKGKALRVSVQPGGCSGYEYAFSFDDKKEGDSVVRCDGFSVLIDSNSGRFLKGSSIEYYEDPTGSGFKVKNPNVKSTCGCGKSNQF